MRGFLCALRKTLMLGSIDPIVEWVDQQTNGRILDYAEELGRVTGRIELMRAPISLGLALDIWTIRSNMIQDPVIREQAQQIYQKAHDEAVGNANGEQA